MTRIVKPRPGFRGEKKGAIGVVYPTPLLKKFGQNNVTITQD